MKLFFKLKNKNNGNTNGVVSSEFVNFTKNQFEKLMKKNIKVPISMITL